MKQIPRIFPGICAVMLLCATIVLYPVLAQQPSPIPVGIEVPLGPTPVKANGKIHLLYELHITNFRAKALELTRIEIINESLNKQTGEVAPMASYEGTKLTDRLSRPGMPANSTDKQIIGGGLRAVVFIQIKVDEGSSVPRNLSHRLFFKPSNSEASSEERLVAGALVEVSQNPLPVISTPLRGKGWLAADGLSNTSEHRRALIAVDGKARIAQRFAIDWVKFGDDGQVARDNPKKNANWYGYGAEVLAVADAVVVDVKDGIPENVPFIEKTAVPITLETIGGNYVMLDLGGGHFAFYAHLQPRSILVKVGAKVLRGEVLGLLGNSGNSDAPHLHFHIADTNSPLGAEGLPFVFDVFEVQGAVESLEVLENGEGWKPHPRSSLDRRQREMPLANAIVRFP